MSIKLWDFESYECVKTLQGHDHIVSCVSYAPSHLFSYQTITCYGHTLFNDLHGDVRTDSYHQMNLLYHHRVITPSKCGKYRAGMSPPNQHHAHLT
jgi:WD40 repeat protein